MNKIISLLLLFLVSLISNAQEIQFKEWNGTNYGAATVFSANGVAEDFGPRRKQHDSIRPSDNRHRGIDYNSVQDDGNNDKWDMILAPRYINYDKADYIIKVYSKLFHFLRKNLSQKELR